MNGLAALASKIISSMSFQMLDRSANQQAPEDWICAQILAQKLQSNVLAPNTVITSNPNKQIPNNTQAFGNTDLKITPKPVAGRVSGAGMKFVLNPQGSSQKTDPKVAQNFVNIPNIVRTPSKPQQPSSTDTITSPGMKFTFQRKN